MKPICTNGKQILDKKSAVTMANLTYRLHHIKMKEYNCPECNFWHLATAIEPGRERRGKAKFRHNL